MSNVQIDEIRRTRDVLLTVNVHSLVDRFVLARNVSPGQKFEEGAQW